MKKVLFVITKSNWGGAQRYVFDMATAAHSAGFTVAVAYGSRGELGSKLETAGIRTIEIPSLGRDISIGADWKAYRALSRVIAAERPDILHLNSSKAGAMGALAGRLHGVPRIIFTAHGWALNEERPLWQKIPIAGIYIATLLLSHRTIAVSQAVAQDMRRMPFISKKILVIHNGISAPEFLPQEQSRTTLLPNQTASFWIGMVGELHKIKRTADAILAFTSIAKEFPHAILVIAGEGEEHTHLQALIEKNHMQQRIFLLGHIPNAATHMKAFDIFLLPSRSEALAYVAVEAGYAGLPVIASNVGGIPEIITDGVSGVLVPRENPQALTDALRSLLNNPDLRKKLGDALQTRVHEEFSLATMVQHTLTVYRS